MKAAIVQFRASTDKEENLGRILSYARRAARRGAALCAFPEFMMFYTGPGQTARQLASLAEAAGGNFVTSIAQCAKDNGIQIVGSFYEKSRKKDRVYDTAFIAGRDGRIISKYRKIHLYDALGFRESDKMAPGSRIERPADTAVGKVGMMVCYDLRFPEMSRALASSGSQVLIAPSAWVRGRMKEEHWVTMNRARAIENGCYVLAPDQVGNIYCGRSLAVDPFGKVLLDLKKREGIGMVEIDAEKIRETRKSLPLLKNRRTDIYPSLRA